MLLIQSDADFTAAGKLKTVSFRGTLRAEESLFSRISNPERFLTSFGMTSKGTFSAAHSVW